MNWIKCESGEVLGLRYVRRFEVKAGAEAIAFVMRSNKRRNLNSGQWAIIANEAEDLVRAISEQVERERLEKQKAHAANQHSEPCNKSLLQPEPRNPNENAAATKLAEVFPTNRTWLDHA